MKLSSHPLAEFWKCYDALPRDIQERADKQSAIFEANPNHASLRFKEISPYLPVRINRGYRALTRRRGNDLYWFSIGPHDKYERILKG